ncbi:replication protein A 70 kDa DNA-binding subunit A-like [Nicotiana tabacum]|uniref:Replication protein A 70 kDa DNA-binding subunit A-like n=2 Tax=Nicotiana tabacum TaxID=4097 RepID=A0A1S4DNN0_TOBAC|nr:PREDICTED: replication protein A 70 kDa DNA-binding subunit A-like [Nicotiana tabacum]
MFKPKIQELGLYFMKNFVVGPNYMKLKYTRHKLKLAFTHKTIVEEANDHLFGMSIFDLKPYEYLINKIDVEESELFDVIGEVVSYGEVESHNQGDKKSAYMNVELEDHERNNISATFWGEFVDQILPHLEGSLYQPVIVVMQLIKAHKFQGKYSVRNTWHVSKLWINPDLPQAVDFKSRLASVNEANSARISQIPSQRSYSVSDKLATGTVEVKTIRELVNCMEEGHIWIVATVVNLLLEKEWSYLGCKKCSKKVDKIGNKFHCKKCDRLDSSATHRYKLRVQVMDHTGFISLLLWDREATR